MTPMIKDLGLYTTENGRKVEIYYIDQGEAQGFFVDNRHMAMWDCGNGKLRHMKFEIDGPVEKPDLQNYEGPIVEE